MIVANFEDASVGMLVKRSAHCIKEKCLKGKQKHQIGIIVGVEFYLDTKAGIITWPVIHWEGQVISSLTHPANAIAYRKRDKLPEIEMSGEEPDNPSSD